MRAAASILCLALAGPLAAAGPAWAQAEAAPDAEPFPEPSEAEQQAQIHFLAGRGHFERGRYELALSEFQAAYQLSPRPGLSYNLYLTFERLGRLPEAVSHLERYVPEAGDDRATLEARLTSLRERVAAQEAAAVAAREREEGAERARQEELARLRAAPTEEGGGVPAAAVVALVAGAAGLATFGAFATLATIENADLADRCGSDAGAYCSDDEVAALSAYDLIADIGLGVALAGAGVGIVLLLLDSDEAPSGDVALAPWVHARGGGLAFRGRL